MAKAKNGATIGEIKELLDVTKKELKTELKVELTTELASLVKVANTELKTELASLVKIANAELKTELVGLVETNTGEIMGFLQEHMVTKEEHDHLVVKVMHIEDRLETFATKDDMHVMKNEIITTIDSFTKRQETFDHELTAMRSSNERLDGRLTLVERKTGLGAKAS